jgi:hypothetical protein
MANSKAVARTAVDVKSRTPRKGSNDYLRQEVARLKSEVSYLMSTPENEPKTVPLQEYVLDKETNESVHILSWQDLGHDIKSRFVITRHHLNEMVRDSKDAIQWCQRTAGPAVQWCKDTAAPAIKTRWRELMDAVDTNAPTKDSSESTNQ